jgi:hypothetical protein
MTNNEYFERKMNFIVEQHAQFAADMQRLEESQARTDQVVTHLGQNVTRLEGNVTRLEGVVTQVAESVIQVGEVVTRLANVTHAGFTDVSAKINALVDAQIRSEERLTQNEEKHAKTEESLKRLSDTVDRYIRERRNGQ